MRQASRWRVVAAQVEARPIYARQDRIVTGLATADPAVLAAARRAHEETLAYVRSPVGAIASPIQSFFALVADDPSVQIVNAAQAWYVRRLAATMPALADLPILSAAAPFKCGGHGGPDYYTDVKAGAIAIKDVADIYLYPNALRAVKIDGATLREWLERSAGLFRRIDPDRDRRAAADRPGLRLLQFRRHRRRDLCDRRHAALALRRRGRARRAAGAPHPRPPLRGRADRRRAGVHRRHQQLPRRAAAASSPAATARRW